MRIRRATSALLAGALVTGLLGVASASAQAGSPTAGESVSGAAARDAQTLIGPQVVNGRLGDPRAFPSLVAIADRARYLDSGLYDAQVCGGTAVTTTLIITAAHCVFEGGRTTSANQIVVARTPSGALTDPQTQVVTVRSITVNPDYDERTQAGDLAVLDLRVPLEGIEPILPALPGEDAQLTPGGATAAVAGWGATTGSGRNFPDRFRVGDLTVFPESACGGGRDYTIEGVTFFGYGPGDVDPEVMLCADGVRNGAIVDSCIGDSGGPLIAGTADERRLVGVVSWGPQRCASTFSGVYTRVSAFTSFLRAQGVPFAPTPTDAPSPPTIVNATVTPTAASVTVEPADTGAAPTSYRVTARDAGGRTASCAMPAPQAGEAPATCTLTNLRTARRYTVTAIALTNSIASEPSAPVTVKPADRPRRPRIADVEVLRGGVAVFDVQRLRANGSAFTKKLVVCVPANRRSGLPKRMGDIGARGITIVTGLRAGADYVCRARVANAVGAQRSSAVTLRAR